MHKQDFMLALMLLALAATIVVGMQSPQIVLSEKGGNSEEAKENNGNDQSDEEEQDTETETEDETETDEADTTEEVETAAAEDPTPGIGNNDNPLGQDNPQPGRVGSHDAQTSGEGANAGGTVTDPTLCSAASGLNNPDCSTTVSANCFGKVIQHEAQEHKEPGSDEGTLGTHSRDPVPELEGNETPRQGIGNQDQGHPSAHGAFNSQFDPDDEENVNENC